jgi:phospholipase C
VLRVIEDNWLSGQRIQPGGSFDTIAGPLDNLFDFGDRDEGGPRKLVPPHRKAEGGSARSAGVG